MSRALTSAQLTEWLAYYQLEPFGPLQWAFYAATVVIGCLAPWRKKGAKALKPVDIFPILGDGKSKLPGREGLKAKLLAWAAEMSAISAANGPVPGGMSIAVRRGEIGDGQYR